MKDETRERQTFDVFLSHNSQDKPAVRALAAILTQRGIRVWFDEDQLIPGHSWQPHNCFFSRAWMKPAMQGSRGMTKN